MQKNIFVWVITWYEDCHSYTAVKYLLSTCYHSVYCPCAANFVLTEKTLSVTCKVRADQLQIEPYLKLNFKGK